MPIPLLDDPEAGMRVYLVRLAPGADAAPQVPHKGVEVVAVIGGLVQVMTTAGRPVLRQGEALLADRVGHLGLAQHRPAPGRALLGHQGLNPMGPDPIQGLAPVVHGCSEARASW